MDELARVELLRGIYGGAAPGVLLGVGDDAAVLEAPDGRLVWTVDEQVEGTHFERAWLAYEDIGWRAVMAAASDVAAMGARPIALLSSLVLPADVDDAAFEALARGTRAASDAARAPVAGGNLARGGALVISTTVLGSARAPVVRGGARPGDTLWLAGPVGLAAAGLRLLRAGASDAAARHGRLKADVAAAPARPRVDAAAPARPRVEAAAPARPRVEAAALAAWRRPIARFAEGAGLAAAGARAAIDVSDGLARDAAHVARASGVALVFDAAALLAHAPELVLLAATEDDALALALYGGEDYALLAAGPAAPAGFARVGEVRAGEGVHLARAGRETPIAAAGFDHFG